MTERQIMLHLRLLDDPIPLDDPAGLQESVNRFGAKDPSQRWWALWKAVERMSALPGGEPFREPEKAMAVALLVREMRERFGLDCEPRLD